jgi:nesprin-1
VICPSPEYFYSTYTEPEYIGVRLEPPGPPPECEDATQVGLSTAAIIASQSQDYVDEKLAEYQATIHQLQGRVHLPANQ